MRKKNSRRNRPPRPLPRASSRLPSSSKKLSQVLATPQMRKRVVCVFVLAAAEISENGLKSAGDKITQPPLLDKLRSFFEL